VQGDRECLRARAIPRDNCLGNGWQVLQARLDAAGSHNPGSRQGAPPRERTVYTLARAGRIGGAIKIGNQWRFDQEALSAWLKSGGAAPTQGAPSRRPRLPKAAPNRGVAHDPDGGDDPGAASPRRDRRPARRLGWVVQSRDEVNLAAARGVAVREFKVKDGFADYVLYVDRQAVGIVEAKKAGHTLTGVGRAGQGLLRRAAGGHRRPIKPLPFVYVSTGAETRFTNLLDPDPRLRRVFQFHRPETLAEWLQAETLDQWVKALHQNGGLYTAAEDTKPSTVRSRIQTLPPVAIPNLWPNKVKALTNLELSLKADKPRSLIQMATGSGKTRLAVTAAYRLIKFGGIRRVLFLVDRGNLGEQTEKEFQSYWTPDDNRKFTELYKVQRLQSNTIAASSKVVITTIQRLYSILKGEPELDVAVEEASLFEADAALPKQALPVVYNTGIPPEYFDLVIVDECHRSIYSLWRQVLEYSTRTSSA